MTHLEIRLTLDRTETVSAAVINKLYTLSFHDEVTLRQLDNSSYLSGRITTAIAGEQKVTFLNQEWGPDLVVSATTYSIEFEDPEVERICVTNWGSDGIVTSSQLAAAATNVGFTFFRNNTSITKFNELRYFTGAANRIGLQLGCLGMSNLLEVTLPSNITLLNQVFKDCTSLTSITIPDGVTSIINGCFDNCPITSLTIPTTVTLDLSLGAMHELTTLDITGVNFSSLILSYTKLTSITLPSTISSIVLMYNDLLTSVTITPGYTNLNLPRAAFSNNPALTLISGLDLSKVTTVGSGNTGGYLFNACSSLTGEWDFTNTTFENDEVPWSFMSGCSSVSKIILPSNLTAIRNSAFLNVNPSAKIVIPCTNPPILGNDLVFLNGYGSNRYTTGCSIYVPDASLSAYQSALNWSIYSSRIFAMSTLT